MCKQARIVIRSASGKRESYYLGTWGSKDSIAQWLYYLGELVRVGTAPQKRTPLSESEERAERLSSTKQRAVPVSMIAACILIFMALVAWGASQWTRYVLRQEIAIAALVMDDENLPPRIFGHDTELIREILTSDRGRKYVKQFQLRTATRKMNAAGSSDTSEIEQIWKEGDKDVSHKTTIGRDG